MVRIDYYKLARVSAIALPIFFILFLVLVVVSLFQEGQASVEPALLGPIGLLITFFGTIVTMVGTVSTVLIGWRNEKRQAREAELRIKQLQLQLEEMERRNNKGS